MTNFEKNYILTKKIFKFNKNSPICRKILQFLLKSWSNIQKVDRKNQFWAIFLYTKSNFWPPKKMKRITRKTIKTFNYHQNPQPTQPSAQRIKEDVTKLSTHTSILVIMSFTHLIYVNYETYQITWKLCYFSSTYGKNYQHGTPPK